MIVCEQETAVVVLSYNGTKWHELFLPVLLQEAYTGYDVIVADNASTDGTQAYVQEHFPAAKTLRIGVNHGFAAGYYEALQQIEAKYYILLSADFEVTPGWYPPLLRAMQQHPGLAACGPKIRYWREREKFEYAGAAGGYMDYLGYMFCRGRMFNDLEPDTGQYDDDAEVFWAGGGCLMVRSDLYHHVGGLDSSYYAHMEEVDLCWRLKNAGYRIGYVGDSTVFHVGGSVISYGSPQKLYYNFRNSLALLLKNERGYRLLWLMPARLMLDGVAGVQMLFSGKFREMITVIKAHFSFYRMIPGILRKRHATKAFITHRNEAGILKKSVVWQYFALGRKKFSQLKYTPPRL